MPSSPAQKFKIKEGNTLLLLHAPADFQSSLGELPPGVTFAETATAFDQFHWFVKDKAQLEEEADRVLALLTDGVTGWIYYPKGSSNIQTDLTRDKGWERLLRHQDIQWLSLVSFNDTWSAFALRRKTGVGEPKKVRPTERPVAGYIDALKKQVFLPDDLAAAFVEAPNEKAFFESLSFTNRKEYVEWVVTAKRAETRENRVSETVRRLAEGWKNPANR